jgi:hypothetical protein
MILYMIVEIISWIEARLLIIINIIFICYSISSATYRFVGVRNIQYITEIYISGITIFMQKE